ncbi:MAG: hypothetical protein R3B09_10990 [Nannocystaceae bacterium]
MSYCLYIYVADHEFPIQTWQGLMTELHFERVVDRAPAPWRWRHTEGDDDEVDVEIHRVASTSALAPPDAHWRIDVRSRANRGAGTAWHQLAVPYRALRALARVEVCDPELWYTPPPRRFVSPEAFYRHASRIVGHLAGSPALMRRGLMTGAGHLLF